MLLQIFQDALFSAIAAIGFAAISSPPKGAYLWCGVISALGHSFRLILMSPQGFAMHIVAATLVASFLIGAGAVFISPRARFPAETCLFPALLPMIPGIYAYKAFGGAALCLLSDSAADFYLHFYQFAANAMTCGSILLCMTVGGTIPIFLFKKISFQATR